jgi:hypothetical protein
MLKALPELGFERTGLPREQIFKSATQLCRRFPPTQGLS